MLSNIILVTSISFKSAPQPVPFNDPEVSLSPVTCASFCGLFFLICEVPIGRIVRLSLSGTCRWAFPDPRMPVSFYWVPLVLESAFSDLTGIFLAYRNIPEGRNSCGSELAFLLVSLSDCLLGRLTFIFQIRPCITGSGAGALTCTLDSSFLFLVIMYHFLPCLSTVFVRFSQQKASSFFRRFSSSPAVPSTERRKRPPADTPPGTPYFHICSGGGSASTASSHR